MSEPHLSAIVLSGRQDAALYGRRDARHYFSDRQLTVCRVANAGKDKFMADSLKILVTADVSPRQNIQTAKDSIR
jgi:hypothetical protein